MVRVFAWTLLAALSIGTVATAEDLVTTAPAETDDMTVIFNGTNLDGWNGDSRLWSVKDGVIHGETTPENVAQGNTFLIWKDPIKDFEVRLSFRCNAVNNSGIMYRSQHVTEKVKNDWVLKGYQYEGRNEEDYPNVPGFIYDERGSRGRICIVGEVAEWNEDGKKVLRNDLMSQADFKKLMKVDDWNDVVIRAKGNHIQHFLNGKLLLDFTDNHPEKRFSEGLFGLQLHAGKPMWAEFKDIRIKSLK
ncbi:hypothetical protein K227x_64710 [Rubripirellula lacrimiformis]|uniref:3-keto-alpha-glucoside-1,2-lyase/3-keto-2-hydroxy-glucal hydratase domain-containing protein n=1 Tax=Rubripirellula lacrimiformis TaxID=1930273 RepID=A0A517NLN4_9BACT|nr:DUF1080 domain-containing protein [Rubripirellula lacrimiformis]QDT08041.1 hypothetical protein K227x_64710 [Rubripirellula lacrimiformis]